MCASACVYVCATRMERKRTQQTRINLPSIPQNIAPPQQQRPMPRPMSPMMPMPGMMPPRPRKRTWKDRLLLNYGGSMHATLQKGELTVPRWIVGRSILFFFIAFVACNIAFGYPLPLDIIMVSVVSVLLFFVGSHMVANQGIHQRERTFLRNVFAISLVSRFIWVTFVYIVFNPIHYGNAMGDGADTGWYMNFAEGLAHWMRDGFTTPFNQLRLSYASAIDDVGYPIVLAIENILTFGISDVLLPLIIKAFLGAYCAICIYRVCKRHFGIGTARLAAIFVALNPNMIYWCGSMMKEAEMVFLCCLFLDKTDFTLSTSNKIGFRELVPGILIGMSLFFFRTALGLVAFFAIFGHLIFVSHKVMSNGKKILAGVLVVATLFVGIGDRFITQSVEHIENVESGGQKTNMEWRSKREGGNEFAKYAGAAVFAPLIFTIPFPTFNQANAEQIVQPLTSGGSFIRNVFSFFVIMVLLLLLISGEWRKHVFILAYTCGYLLVLVLSGYAQSGRFHMPIWPMLMLFAAYGIQIAKSNKRLQHGYNLILVLEVFVCLAWNWFKLKGRGMI